MRRGQGWGEGGGAERWRGLIAGSDEPSRDVLAINTAKLVAFVLYTRGGSQGLILTGFAS
jgi:hypothetical protein